MSMIDKTKAAAPSLLVAFSLALTGTAALAQDAQTPAAPAAPTPAQCAPQGDLQFLCDLGNAEDLAALMPADARVTRAALRERGAHALSPWWNALPYPRMKRWWMHWPDAFGARDDAETLLRMD